MNRTLAILFTGAALIIGGWPSEGVRVGTESALSNAAPSPSAYGTAQPPAYEVISGVCVARDPDGAGRDVFGYDGYWYANRDGFWFRSRSYPGPYEAVGFGGVPARVLSLPARIRMHAARP